VPGEKMHSCIPKPSIISLTLPESHLTTSSMRPHRACNRHKRKELKVPVVSKTPVMDLFKTKKFGNVPACCYNYEKRTNVE